jgi:hypothetical protein
MKPTVYIEERYIVWCDECQDEVYNGSSPTTATRARQEHLTDCPSCATVDESEASDKDVTE